jgi:hypothetical protein
MIVTLKSGQTAFLILISGAFAVIQFPGHRQTTVVSREFINERLHTRHSPPSYPVRKRAG